MLEQITKSEIAKFLPSSSFIANYGPSIGAIAILAAVASATISSDEQDNVSVIGENLHSE